MKLIIDTMEFVVDDYMPVDNEIVVKAVPNLKINDYTVPICANLIEKYIGTKEAKKYRIRQKAKLKLERTKWRVERAQERAITGAKGETLMDVLLEREAIRKEANRLELDVDLSYDTKE